MKYYVNCNRQNTGDGSNDNPFKTIQEAADIAAAGDEIIVYPGVYREHVNPKNPGTKEKPVTYRSFEKLGAVITGAEEVKSWERVDGSVWKANIPNGIFGTRNPYKTLVEGDWYMAKKVAHTGDVFLNDKSMYEVTDLELVKNPVVSKVSWDPEFSTYTWYTEQDDRSDTTVIYANFHDYDPNVENVEISVRYACFYPEAEGVNYIILKGFTVCKAATQWAPPTALQEGMIGPHWSMGWVIEDCEVYESKCSGISLGKYLQEGNDNKWLKYKLKDGTQTERDCICRAQYEGWTKERIGHHTVRRCNIHDCGQTGIVGHLGGVFSLIEDNHIHHINNKQNLAGAEIGGIKMHAAIDVVFRRNHIHHCTRGIWLDWQAQGTRVTRNFMHHNTLPNIKSVSDITDETFGAVGEDIFIEVSHGPTLIDNNILMSARSVKIAAQGVALVHNLVGGSLAAIGIGTDNGAKTRASVRYTPYHVPHRTEIAGFMSILHGDARFYNNIFIQQDVNPGHLRLEESMGSDGNMWDDGCMSVGTMRYDGYMSEQEWLREFDGYCGMGAGPSDRYYIHLPVWASGNAYFNGARAWEKEEKCIVDTEHRVELKLYEDGGKWTFETDVYDYLPTNLCEAVSTETLGMAFEPEQYFENPDGTQIVFNKDYYGNKRGDIVIAGPFAVKPDDSLPVF